MLTQLKLIGVDRTFGGLEFKQLLIFNFSICHVDPTLTVENVTDVMEKIAEDRRRQVWDIVLEIVYGYKEETRVYMSSMRFTTAIPVKERRHACSDMYVNCHPDSSWENLTSQLYKEDEMTAVGQAMTFLPPRGKSILLIINNSGFICMEQGVFSTSPPPNKTSLQNVNWNS